jgi:trans-2,3-dihydro-3-hydroxyanthranilate isomerase
VATIVDACRRGGVDDGGVGGSPTAVVDDDGSLSDQDRVAVAAGTGTSHTAFVSTVDRADGSRAVRFFTGTGELTGCGHGTVAAQAVLLDRLGVPAYEGWQQS